MAYLGRRVLVRCLAMSLVLATILTVVSSSFHGNITPAKAQHVERAAVVTGFLDALNRGDVDAAASFFADTAVYVGTRPTGGCSYRAPCTDLAGIRQQTEGNVAVHLCMTPVRIDVEGAVVSGRLVARADTIRANGVERIMESFVAVVPQNKITFLALAWDLGDPQTALNAAVSAGTQPAGTPVPTPDTPCG